MDIPGADLIAKSEEYFGKRVTTIVMATIMITSMTICLNLLLTHGVIPIYKFWTAADHNLLSFLGRVALTFLLGFATGVPPYLFTKLRVERTFRRSLETLQKTSYISLHLHRSLRDAGHITQDEYEARRSEVLRAQSEIAINFSGLIPDPAQTPSTSG